MIQIWCIILFIVFIYLIYKFEHPTGYEHVQYFNGPKLYPIIGALAEVVKHSSSLYGLLPFCVIVKNKTNLQIKIQT
jgi:hypothetical protein